jgi:DNA-binding CsgD family transcriptional regulator
MADLQPDNWNAGLEDAAVFLEGDEEIGYRTHGWSAGQQELGLMVDLPNGAMAELSLTRPASEGGFSQQLVDRLEPFYPIFAMAFRQLWTRQSKGNGDLQKQRWSLDDFATETLSPREVEVVQMILKGHSSLSISLTLKIALPTVKSHRKNAYAKLGISTQQQLFNTFLNWKENNQ